MYVWLYVDMSCTTYFIHTVSDAGTYVPYSDVLLWRLTFLHVLQALGWQQLAPSLQLWLVAGAPLSRCAPLFQVSCHIVHMYAFAPGRSAWIPIGTCNHHIVHAHSAVQFGTMWFCLAQRGAASAGNLVAAVVHYVHTIGVTL